MTKRSMMSRRLATVLAFCLIPAGCSILESGKPARQVYLLQTPPAHGQAQPADGARTLILSVKAVPGLDTDRILVLAPDAHLVPVANAHWPDHLPEVFTSITRRYLSDTRQFLTVRGGSIARPDEWLLELELQAFFGIQDAAGETSSVELKMEGLLHCLETKKVLRLAEQAPVYGSGLSVLVAAYQQVVNAGMQALSAELSEACTHPAAN